MKPRHYANAFARSQKENQDASCQIMRLGAAQIVEVAATSGMQDLRIVMGNIQIFSIT
jgi:hypothetical protein